MSLSVGIVGLPNVGKSTLFNALLKRQISAEGSYPFTTIKPHEGVVAVPDEKLKALCRQISPEKCVAATVTFVDIAGLVKNAYKGEGLGNEFLGHVRNVDLIVHVLRAFDEPDIPHVEGSVDPERDRKIIQKELAEAQIDKPIIEWVNASIDDFDNVGDLIKKAYGTLGLVSFYTIKSGKEVHAWALREGANALDAAERVHSDFAKNFIKAEVISADELLSQESWKKAKEKGKIRLEGKDYIIQDGDVIEFLVSR